MTKTPDFTFIIAVFVSGFGVGLTTASQVIKYTDIEPMKEQAIKIGCAHHNPKTGDFEWLNTQSK